MGKRELFRGAHSAVAMRWSRRHEAIRGGLPITLRLFVTVIDQHVLLHSGTYITFFQRYDNSFQ